MNMYVRVLGTAFVMVFCFAFSYVGIHTKYGPERAPQKYKQAILISIPILAFVLVLSAIKNL